MMLYLLCGFFAVQMILVIILLYGYSRTKREAPRSMGEQEGMTLVIPFRDEENRMHLLIDSLNKAHLPESVEVLFVDDHSSDGSVRLLTSTIRVPFQLIRNEGEGKKEAIRTGVRMAAHNKIVTLDSDVSFESLYIIEAMLFNQQDMTIFPVRMIGNRPIQLMGSVEFSFLQLITFGMAGFSKPVLSNGANLGFRRTTFLQIDVGRTDYSVASGDDIFLLNEMRSKNHSIWAVSNADCFVNTEGPRSFSALLKQRKRWFGKMIGMMDFWAVIGVLLLFLSQIGLFLALFGLAETSLFLLPLALKSVSEWMLDTMARRRFSIGRFGLVLLHQLYYPIYLLSLLIPLKKEVKWSKNT